jgi:hypothetical protein
MILNQPFNKNNSFDKSNNGAHKAENDASSVEDKSEASHVGIPNAKTAFFMNVDTH